MPTTAQLQWWNGRGTKDTAGKQVEEPEKMREKKRGATKEEKKCTEFESMSQKYSPLPENTPASKTQGKKYSWTQCYNLECSTRLQSLPLTSEEGKISLAKASPSAEKETLGRKRKERSMMEFLNCNGCNSIIIFSNLLKAVCSGVTTAAENIWCQRVIRNRLSIQCILTVVKIIFTQRFKACDPQAWNLQLYMPAVHTDIYHADEKAALPPFPSITTFFLLYKRIP